MISKTTPTVHMGQIVGAEARKLYATNPVILLPMGSQEDQGPHAPMGDYLLAEKIAELAALRAHANGVPTVVAPVVAFGGADWFGAMPGGIALSQSTLTQVIREMIDNLHRHGLTRIVFINGHGGNVGPIAEIAREVYLAKKLVHPSLYLWRIAYGMLTKMLGPEKAAAVSGHGADPLTSVLYHLFPGAVAEEHIPGANPLKRDKLMGLQFTTLGAVSFEGHEIGMPQEYDEVYNAGVSKGDPRLSSVETGKALTESLVDVCARFVALYASKTKPA
ncbi:MAG: creatininase [Tagaea sp. CACIAM 22H2]|nr:creatininase [Tagaea sp. CACIAM 22H2]